MSKQDLLDKTLAFREKILDQHFKDIPTDKDEQSFLVKILDGIDRTVLSKRKLDIEEDAAAKLAQAQDMVAEMVLEAARRRASIIPRETIPELPNEIVLVDAVEGELDLSPEKIDYDTFVKRMN